MICWRRSGEALTRTNGDTPSADPLGPVVTAMLAWVRGLTRRSPAHASLQTPQLQFHWGKPPPAAAPRTKAERRPMRRLSFLESLSDSLAYLHSWLTWTGP